MAYDTPVLQEVGSAAHLVLGYGPGSGDGMGAGISQVQALAIGLDE